MENVSLAKTTVTIILHVWQSDSQAMHMQIEGVLSSVRTVHWSPAEDFYWVTVPAPGKKSSRKLAPDPGLPEGMHII